MAERFAVNRLPGFTTIAVLAFLALYIPIVTLVFFSFNAGKTVMDWSGFSLQWYAVAWSNLAVQEAAWRSVVIAFWATVIATVAATQPSMSRSTSP
jgi:spermidine/putrescine transport system permease protein